MYTSTLLITRSRRRRRRFLRRRQLPAAVVAAAAVVVARLERRFRRQRDEGDGAELADRLANLGEEAVALGTQQFVVMPPQPP